jgi:2,3,4,5-tetrahydropyridine-2-carboxylate N-succinyltransferase
VTAVATLEERVEALFAADGGAVSRDEAGAVVDALLGALERGEIRAAERGSDGRWQAVPWVKRGILCAFRYGTVVDLSPDVVANRSSPFHFFDKDLLPARLLALEDGVRVVPGGTSIRRGSFVAPGVVCMPPVFVNAGAWVGAGTMLDSHALVGSCAQLGARVHLSAAAQVGGVLEPVNASPVVIEDDVIVGGNCGVYEGTVVRARAVLASGTILTRGTPVFDLVHERVYRAEGDTPLEIPEAAVVVPGARTVRTGWGADQGLSLQTPVIVKYRDERTDLSTALESWLR